MSDPGNVSGGNVRRLIQQFETGQPQHAEAKKISNGRTIEAGHELEQGQKTDELAQSILPTKEEETTPKNGSELKNRAHLERSPSQERFAKRFGDNFLKAPPLSSSTKEVVQRPAKSISDFVAKVWQQVRKPSTKSAPSPFTSQIDSKSATPSQSNPLEGQINSFNAAIRKLEYDDKKKFQIFRTKYKITINDKGEISLIKRGFGRTRGSSEDTKKMIESLKKMGTEALSSNDPKQASAYLTMLNDLSRTKWVEKAKRNETVKLTIDQLLKSFNTSLQETVEAHAPIIDTALTSNNRKELATAITILSNIPQENLTEEQSKSLEIAKSTADTTLSRLDGEAIKNSMLGTDPYPKSRELLMKGAGEFVKIEAFVKPMQEALNEIKLMEPGEAEKALNSLTEFALRLATIPDVEKSGLKPVLENLLAQGLDHENEEIQQKAKALEVLLALEDPMPHLDEFKTAVSEGKNDEAFKQMFFLTNLPQSVLQSPINPEQFDSPTIHQSLMTVRNANADFEEPVAVFDLLMQANAEKGGAVEQKTLPSIGAYSLERSNDIVHAGEKPIPKQASSAEKAEIEKQNEAINKERKTLVEAMTKDLRAIAGSQIKQIGLEELRNQAWSKKKENAPNVITSIKSFNNISNAVQASILESKDQQEAINALNLYVDVLDSCIKDNNYNGAMALYSALNSSPIYRIVSRPGVLSPTKIARLNAIGKILSHESSSKALREETATALSQGKAPVPYIGTLLSDLTFSDDGNPNEIEGMVNTKKIALINDQRAGFAEIRDKLRVSPYRSTETFTTTPKIGKAEYSTKDTKEAEQGNSDFNKAAYDRSLELFPRPQQ